MFQAVIDFLKDYGPWGLLVHSFLDAVIFPIPAFFSQVSLSILNPKTALWLATVGYIGCLIGTPVGYYLGKVMGKSIRRVETSSEMQEQFDESELKNEWHGVVKDLLSRLA